VNDVIVEYKWFNITDGKLTMWDEPPEGFAFKARLGMTPVGLSFVDANGTVINLVTRGTYVQTCTCG
jgi:hypothetical protein